MSDPFKSNLEKANQFLERIVDQVEDQAEDFAEDSRDLWHRSKLQVQQLKKRLSQAVEHLDEASDEAKLQAHLAAMDAHDHWSELQHNVHVFVQHAEDQSRPVIDHALLQAHLAKMDARDFMAESADTLADDYRQSKQKVEKASLKAAAEIRERCEGLIAGLPK